MKLNSAKANFIEGQAVVAFLIRRSLWTLGTVWAVATLSFFLVRAAPGDPFASEVRNSSKEVQEQLKKEYHLDRPLYIQYGIWLGDVALLDFGDSMKYQGKTVNEIIGQAFPVSLALGSLAMAIAILIGLSTGVVAAVHQNKPWDYGLMAFAIVGISMPSFVIATLLIVVFVFNLSMFPSAGWSDYQSVVLPAFALSLPFAALISRLARVGMLDVLSNDYIRTARAKGLASHEVLIKHALKGAILPVVSYLGPAFAAILTGSLVVEKIFGIAGLGQIFVQSAINRDYNVALGTVVVFSTLLCVLNFLVDLSYAWLDPRVKLEEA